MNLRKDHCRCLNIKRPANAFTNFLCLGGSIVLHARTLPAPQQNPGAGRAKELKRIRPPPAPPRCAEGGAFLSYYSQRLSATDISALASMKNVAKCDTWCELQDPANHRVFERKLRPEPSGRGHVCLGVTHRCPPRNPPSGWLRRCGHTLASRAHRRADGLNSSPRRLSSRHYGG